MLRRCARYGPNGYFLLFFLVVVTATLVTLGCDGADEAPRPYLILYAFAEEGDLIRDGMASISEETHLGRKVAQGVLFGKEVVLAELGIGMNNAAMTTQRMLDYYGPKAVIVSGIAGSIDTSVNIGDIVVCDSWVVHDYGYVGSDGFVPYGIEVALPGVDSLATVIKFDSDSIMLHVAGTLDVSGLNLDSVGDRTPQLRVSGVGVSGNTFIDSEKKRRWLGDRFGALITDMESAAVAQVCTVNGIPFIIFRSASDLAGGSGSETAKNELNEFFRVAADNSSKVVMKFMESL